MLQIEQLLERKPRQLSGGQRQRVAMGRALARDPALFLFDEPLSNLDAKLRVEMRTEIKLLHQRIKTTIVYVTHDQIEAMTLGDRIAVMKDGADPPVRHPAAGLRQSGQPVRGRVHRLPVDELHPLPPGRAGRQPRGCAGNGGRAQLLPAGAAAGVRASSRGSGARSSWASGPSRSPPDSTSRKATREIHEIECQVRVLEPTGPDTLVFVSINGREVTCRVNPKAARPPGQNMKLMVDMSKALLFDPSSEQRIGA